MATNYWLGTADRVSQVSSATITGYDVTTTYKVTIGGVTISQIGTGGTANATAIALVTLLAASIHPYISMITWSAPGSGVITGTVKSSNAGVPFTATSSVSGGTGTFGAFSTTTANAGPSTVDTAANWSLGAAPANGDDVVIKDSSNPIYYGLDQNAVTLNSLRIEKTFTGALGLNRSVFATTYNGSTNTSYTEYKDTYFRIKVNGDVRLGDSNGIGAASGSGRIMLDLSSQACNVYILGTATSSSDNSRPVVRLKMNSASTIVNVASAPGGVGIATDTPGETSTLSKVVITDVSALSRVVLGEGVTITSTQQMGGFVLARCPITTANLYKSSAMQTEGTGAVTTINQFDFSYVISNSSGTITTLNLNGGTFDALQSRVARTISSLVWGQLKQSNFLGDSAYLTVSAKTFPTSEPYKIVIEV